MRILHTADWHMNDTLDRVDRSDDIRRALRQIAAYLEQYAVDVMLVAGDLLSDRSRLDLLRTAVGDIKDIFGTFLQRGGTIVAISGNHDNEAFFVMLRDALDMVSPGQPGPAGAAATGRLYAAPNPRTLPLADRNGQVVQFVLMPYPTARGYLYGEAAGQYRSIEERHRTIQAAFSRVLRQLESKLDLTLPSVLVSHIHVRGARVHSLYRLTEVDDIVFEPTEIPTGWAYVAYGHIHMPQEALTNAAHIRYAGSVERLDANERDDAKSVVLCDIGRSGRVGVPQLLPLNTTPIYQVAIDDPERQIPLLAAQYPDAQRALVTYTLHWQPGRHNRDALRQEIEAIFPRWYAPTFKEIGRDADGAHVVPRLADPVQTVRTYLAEALHTHPSRAALLELAEGLLSEEGWR